MVAKKKRLAQCRLYLILDAQVCSYDRLFDILKAVAGRGVDIVQLRDKRGTARDILGFSRQAVAWLKGRVPFIVNDRADLALAAGADGVHLGQDDMPLAEARKILGYKRIIGVSCQTIAHVRNARAEGADYIGFGSVFRTKTKSDRQPMAPELIRNAVRGARVPLFAIGGIADGNILKVMACGVGRVAVCRDILLADDVRRSVEKLKNILAKRQ